MITARPQKNLQTAREYFRQHLAQGEYHSQSQRVAGHWFGKGAARLGLDLAGPVAETQFARLCENQHPVTGQRLTVRRRQKDHRVFYDFAVSAPKSVSVMALVGGDQRLFVAHDEAARVALAQMEQVAATRVRQGGQDGERTTGEIVAGVFRHDTSRALDPQLHTHFVVFNATWDAVEERWKALQTSRMFDRMTFYTEVYRSELATRLRALGYELRHTDHGFEIAGVSAEILDRFSKRRRAILEAEPRAIAEINARRRRELEETLQKSRTAETRAAAEQALRDFVPITRLTNAGRSNLAHSTRAAKTDSLTAEEVSALQRAQLSDEEHAALRRLMSAEKPPAQSEPAPTISPAEAIAYARDHHFERQSVVEVHDLMKTALAYSRGSATLGELEAELAHRREFLRVEDELTTTEMLQSEQHLIGLVNRGVNRCRPLNAGFFGTGSLTGEQQAALRMILSSPDRVIGLRGGAGTGKTTLLRELVRGIEERQSVTVLAPTTAGVESLRKAGLSRAATVQRFLADEGFRQETLGQVLLVDEAGLLSTKDLVALVEHVERGGRLVLSGDTRQHTGIEAGDALRLLEERSALRVAGVHTIRRQVNREYREAIAELAKGNGLEGLTRLERLGAVTEMAEPDRYAVLATQYVASLKANKSALIVSPTWREIEAVTVEVRDRLKAEGLLGGDETKMTVHRGLKWTRAQKRDMRNYRKGLVLSFHRSTQSFAAGEWANVVQVGQEAIEVQKPNGRRFQVTKKQAECFEVAEPQPLSVATGERILIQGNRKADGLFNGQLATVKSVQPDGRIELKDGRTMAVDFRAFTHGYCVTSHASQGRTVDHVYVAVNSASWQATHRNQFYVSASRGREQVQVYTDDLEFLRSAVRRSAARLSASEMMESWQVAQRVNHGQRQRVRTRLAV